MRALRDFNIPKIVTDDLPIFMGLIGDLFPALDVPRKRDMDLEKQIRQAITDIKLQPEDSFLLKVSFDFYFLFLQNAIINYLANWFWTVICGTDWANSIKIQLKFN